MSLTDLVAVSVNLVSC